MINFINIIIVYQNQQKNIGKDLFKGLKVIEATKTSAEVIKLEAPKYGITAVEYINGLYEYYGDSYNLKIDNTKDQNVRYYGSNPNNYVSFNNELWRIIGVFENNVKLIRKDSLGNLSWDTSDESINGGAGINQWGESTDADGNEYAGADLQVYLNKMYYGGDTTVTCYIGRKNATTICPKDSKGNFLTINETSKSLIDNHIWNTGAIESKVTDTLSFYSDERGTKTGKICTSGDYCNDTVIRTTEWTGYVALPYVTDYVYASENSVCETNMATGECNKNNWLHKGSGWGNFIWYLSPKVGSTAAVWQIYGDGFTNVNSLAYMNRLFFPAIYLKSNVLMDSGNGTSSDSYILKASA